jgi:hypothetical protein
MSCRPLVALATALLLAVLVPGAPVQDAAAAEAARPTVTAPAAPALATVTDGFTLAVAGDLLGPWNPVMKSADPGLDAVAGLITEAQDWRAALFALAVPDLRSRAEMGRLAGQTRL